ncbi:hypothetical protein ASD93_11280 [Microbacterium sp. Root180]|nr:hypothetical protein ASD93_11280 [Microbacterium sp. Root180]
MSRIGRFGRALVLIAAASTALAACAGPSESGSDAGEVGTVEFPNWMWSAPDNAPFWQAMKAGFEEEHAGATLTDDVIPGGEYQDKMFTLLSSGNPPDLVTPFDPTLRAWMGAGLLEPLDPWLEEAGYDLDSFIPANQMAKGEDGKIYGVILVSNPRVMFVNKRLLEEHGLDIPTTPEEVREVSEQLHAADPGLYGFATMSASAAAFPTYGELVPIVKSFGGDFVRDGEAVANSEETVEALEWIKAMHDDGLIPTGQTELVYREAFAQGKIASLVVGSFIMAIIAEKNPDALDDFIAVPLPFGTERTSSANGFLAIPKDAKNKEGAAKVVLQLLQDEWQRKLVEMSAQTPARPGMTPEEYVAENPWFQTVVDAVPNAESVAPSGVEELAPSVQDAVTRHYQELLFTDASAQDVADRLQDELTQILAN